MNKIRILFILLVLIVSILAFVLFTRLQAPFDPNIDKISEFQITRISGTGSIYSDRNPVTGMTMSRSNIVDIKAMLHRDEMYIKADAQTSFEFHYMGTCFTVLPGANIYHQPKTKELVFHNGEYFWNREIKKKDFQISIAADDEGSENSPPMILTIPDAGRLNVNAEVTKVWNYSGNLKLNFDNQGYGLKANQMMQIKDRQVQVFDILPPPEFISPEDKVITLSKPGDSFLKFSWRAVIGAKEYILRIYSSDLKENLLEEMILSEPRKSFSLAKYGLNEIFWQVFPYDTDNEREGSPSRIGNIKLIGSLDEVGSVMVRPNLVITSLSTSGNMVLIKGEADKECQLFINDKPVAINMDGTFIETLTYSQIGTKTITFRLVSPKDIETNITRTVTIFDE